MLGTGRTRHLELPGGNWVCYKRSHGLPMTYAVKFLSHRNGLLSGYPGNGVTALGILGTREGIMRACTWQASRYIRSGF